MHLRGPAESAHHNGLVHVTYSKPGISRIRRGQSFIYRSAAGKAIRNRRTLRRLKALAVPPAWERVWICPSPNGHIQATGFDTRGRRQYQYHPTWTATRNIAKFETLPRFAATLSALRSRIQRDLGRRELPREKVTACIVHLMDRTLIRVGSSEYARENSSYGLTTVLNRHARVKGPTIHFKFKAKSGRICDISIASPRAARIVRKCQELTGQELFCYCDDSGDVHDVGSTDVNTYLAQCTGGMFTAKDFRTWGGTCAAVEALCKLDPPARDTSEASLQRACNTAIEAAASALGNTAAVCRKFYIHPSVLEVFASGQLHRFHARAARQRTRHLAHCERTLILVLESPKA
jgi:DNA topoisomerase I